VADREREQQQNDPGRLEGAAQNRSAGVVTPTSSVQRQAATGTGWKPAASKELPMSEEVTKEVLVVISKVKSYIRAKSSMNTSDAVTEALSELVRTTCDQAIEKAKSEGRKTVMARDISGSNTPE
jgi:histone H3/H4